ncbi:RNA-binding protein Musashi like protein Rbp6, partial [Cyphomyrmex costatus]
LISWKHFNPRRGGSPVRAVLWAQNEKLLSCWGIEGEHYGCKNTVSHLGTYPIFIQHLKYIKYETKISFRPLQFLYGIRCSAGNGETEKGGSRRNTTQGINPSGFGFITFADPASVDKVLAQGNHELDGKKVSNHHILLD